MMNFLGNVGIADILASLVGIVVAISVHEFGHAYAAHLFGDDTAKNAGRMSLNPANHLDPVGIIFMLIFKIGWARPVPVNMYNIEKKKLGNIVISLAGVFMNIVFAIVGVLLFKHVKIYAISMISQSLISYNLVFACFNLMPIPPLDGWSFLSTFMPARWDYQARRFERYSIIFFILLIWSGLYSKIMYPLYYVLRAFVLLFA